MLRCLSGSLRLAPACLAALAAACVPRLYTERPNGPDDGSWEPPANGWPMAEPPAGLAGEGFDEGEVPPDFRLVDQHGDEVSLWQFWGQVVLLDVSTMWCAPCRDIAAHAQETQDDYGADGFVYLTVLQQNVEGGPPTGEDLESWADVFGISGAPVLADGDASATGGAVRLGQFPAVLVLDRALVVAERVNPVDDPTIRAAIEEAL